jgi:hypothetical protein
LLIVIPMLYERVCGGKVGGWCNFTTAAAVAGVPCVSSIIDYRWINVQ